MKKKLLISLLAVVAALVLVELLLRVAFAPYITAIYALDERCLFRPIANAAHYAQQPAPDRQPVLVELNGRGYRGPDRTAPPNALRVAVFGDSFIMAEFTALEATFCAVLERELAAAISGPAFVVNAGAAGAGPDQYVVRIEDEVDALAPNLVVVAVFAGNDFGDLVRDKMFRVGADGEVVPNAFTISDRIESQFALARAPAIWRLAHRIRAGQRFDRGQTSLDADMSEQQRAELGRTIVTQHLDACRSEYDGFVRNGRNDVRSLLEDHWDADVAIDPDGEAARYKNVLMQGVLGRIKASLAKRSIKLLIVAIPSPIDACDDYRRGIVDRNVHPAYRRSRLTDEVVRIAGAIGAPCLDLFGAFHSGGAELYIRAPDEHWNERGQALAARLVRDKILADGLLGSR